MYKIDPEIIEMMEAVSFAAISRYMASRESFKDLFSKKEAQDYARFICDKNALFPKKQSGATILKEWIEAGYIKGERVGATKNSKIYFRKSEIDTVVANIKASIAYQRLHLRCR